MFWRTEILILITFLISVTMANENAKAITKANNGFANKLYEQFAKKPGNIIFSPTSAHTVLSLLHQGAAGASEVALASTLDLPDKTKSADGFAQIMSDLNNVQNVTLEMANKVFVMQNYNLKKSFKEVAVKSFFAEADNIDFAKNVEAAKTINDWVEVKTNHKIKDLIQSSDLDALTRLVLVNAIYFKGDWKDKFEKSATTDDKFYINDKDTVPCRMMHATRKYDYAESAELDAQILSMPYKNENVKMIIILPKQRDGIDILEEKLKNYDLTTITGQLHNQEVQLSMPTFKAEVTLEMNEPLKEIGLANIFSSQADLSGLLEEKENLYVSKVVQKAFIEVNEEGAEAAAATGMIMMACCMPMVSMQIEFIADHPFIYYINYKEHSLFQGKLTTAK